MNPGHLAKEVIKSLHQHLADHPGTVAAAFPKARSGDKRSVGNVIRLFSDDSAALDTLADRIESRKALRDLISVGRTREVPGDPKSWVAYTRFRLPSRKRQKKDTDQYFERRCRLRAEKAAMLDKLPSIFMRSSTNMDNEYGLGIEVMVSGSPDLSVTGQLNGYGLSSRSQPVWLPDLG
jgi:CRISPR-associated endoribonuclease Cas6/Csy4 subtype I-F